MSSATDIANFLDCKHLTALDRAEAAGEMRRPFFKDPGLELLRKLGLEHEHAYLRQLQEQGRGVAAISTDTSWDEAAAKTVEAMKQGVDTVYQATFLDSPWIGRADFLVRVDTPSALWPWSYEVVETKLARSTKVRALIQLCFYSDLLSKIQGVQPEFMHIVLAGGASPEKFAVKRYNAYFRKVRRDYVQAWNANSETYPEPAEHCSVCKWLKVCDERRRADDHLSLVAGITRSQRSALVERGVSTVVNLGELAIPVTPKIERIGPNALRKIREQACLQVDGRNAGRLLYELLQPVEAERGLAALPPPSAADIFLDFESDPYAIDQGLEYLIGIVTTSPEPNAQPVYDAIWAFNRAEEKKAFETFIANLMERWRLHPELHVYHYAPYEPTAIKRLAGRHGTCVEEVDQLLRAGVFVDLYRVVRQGLRASVESYSIKKIEPLYGFTRDIPMRDANLALQAFENVMALDAEAAAASDLLDAIAGYNRDDCISALRLRDWLETLRQELEVKTGELIPRPALQSGEPSEDLADQLSKAAEVEASLTTGLPEDEADWTDEDHARWLLAQLLEWHRREDKSSWWEYFRLCELSDGELLEDRSAMGGLSYKGEVGTTVRSVIHRYSFPPQDHTIDRPGKNVRDPKTRKGTGEVVAIDEANGTIDIKRSVASSAPHPTALVPRDIVDTPEQRESLLRLGSWVAKHGINVADAGALQFQAAQDLLLRRPPKMKGGRSLKSVIGQEKRLVERARQLVLALDSSVLAVQGPPGSGKTYAGARMIVELVKQGKRVGITAASHKVIGNLLSEVCKAATEAGATLLVVQKAEENEGCHESIVRCVKSNAAVLGALSSGEAQVAAGTAWLWAREEMADSVDVLFVDEAGQMSLANVLSIAQGAVSVVLLGDPQQLEQPQRGIHPPGADVSALAHLLNGSATIGDDQGLFLAETWRLAPGICAFTSEAFYDGRLLPRPENSNQRVNAQNLLDGAGLRFVPVQHSGNQSESPEEAAKVKDLVDALLMDGPTWTDKNGETLALLLEHILIVAPYNAQVSALARNLPAGARVGTVDKFQGQQAPVVIYSMTTSSPEDAPRGMEFLYSLNRLNVATSRAQCLAVVVASPALFHVQCKTPRQIELANAFCRYLEMARVI